MVAAARRGDGDAYAELVSPLLPSALRAATAITGSAAIGQEVVQEALISAWQGISALRAPDAFPAWFRRQVVRASTRAAQRERRVSLPLASLEDQSNLERTISERQLHRAFVSLEVRDRAVLTLHFLWRLPVRESAELLGLPPGTVKSRTVHALARLRAAYDAEERTR